MDRWGQRFQLSSVCFYSMMQKSSQMHAGHSALFLLAQLTKSKWWSRQVYVADLCSSFCKYQFFYPCSKPYSFAILDYFGSNCICIFWRHPSPSVLYAALRTVANIVTGGDMQTQVIISCLFQIQFNCYWLKYWIPVVLVILEIKLKF